MAGLHPLHEEIARLCGKLECDDNEDSAAGSDDDGSTGSGSDGDAADAGDKVSADIGSGSRDRFYKTRFRPKTFRINFLSPPPPPNNSLRILRYFLAVQGRIYQLQLYQIGFYW
jgi:hypothetical protein